MPPKKTKKTKKVVIPQEFSLESDTLRKRLEDALDDESLKKVKKISYYIGGVGLTVEESCLLADVEPEWLKKLIEISPVVERLMQIKELEYKKDLLTTLSGRAREGDDKLAQWLMERRYRDEYGAPKKVSGDAADDAGLLVEAIRYVQKTGDSQPLVGDTAGDAKKTGSTEKTGKFSAVEKLEKVLV